MNDWLRFKILQGKYEHMQKFGEHSVFKVFEFNPPNTAVFDSMDTSDYYISIGGDMLGDMATLYQHVQEHPDSYDVSIFQNIETMPYTDLVAIISYMFNSVRGGGMVLLSTSNDEVSESIHHVTTMIAEYIGVFSFSLDNTTGLALFGIERR